MTTFQKFKFPQILFLLFSAIIASCTQNGNEKKDIEKQEVHKYGHLEKDSIHYSMDIEATDRIDSTVVVKFRIDNKLVDSLKLPEQIISSICKTASTYGDWDVKNKRTYKFNPKRKSLVYLSEGDVIAAIEGIAANSYGVEGNICTFVHFDTKGNVIKEGEFNAPKIWTN